jgi:hypothetical protein
MLMEQLEYNLLYDRLLEGEIAEGGKRLLSDEHFTVDGTLIEA